jgi:DNA-binding MarR family transcriptional regulator
MVGDLTATQFSALVTLAAGPPASPPLSQNRLGRLTAMDAATVKGVIDRLVGRGLVMAEPDARDARLRRLSLTAAGRALLDKALPAAEAISAATLAPLDPAESAQLLTLLARLR